MDNVMNRPLFRRREARVRSDMEMEARRVIPSPILGNEPSRPPSGIESALMATDPYLMETFAPAQTTQRPKSARELAAERTGGTLRSALSSLADMGAGALSAAGSGLYGAASDVLSPAFAMLGATTLAAQLERQSDIAYNVARSNLANGLSATEGMSAEDFDMEPAEFSFIVARAEADAREEARIGKSLPPPTGPSGMEMEARGSRPAAPMGPSGMEAEARGSRPPAAAPGTAPAAVPRDTALGPSVMEEEARARGPLITNPTEVAAGLNAPDPAVRERTVQDFMREFTENAPKYEGTDKRLIHAMIGFAIAAGDSPNAMTNIARGLQAGADMMLKDKAAKDEFDRQIQLSAMQYGLGEVAKDRALDRQFTNYVATQPVTYRGKTYGPNESVPVLHSDIINGRMPSGIVTEGTSDALLAADTAVRKSLVEAAKEQKLSGAEYRAAIETLDQAASDYTSARNLMPLLEASLVRAANGEVTGIDAALTRKINETMNAFGLKPPAEYESPEAFESALRQVSVSMVQDLLGESGKTISDADRRLIDGLIGLQQDIVSGVIKDPDILTRKVQELMRTLEGKQRSALDVYTTAMEGYGGSLTPSGTPVRSYRAERVFNPEQTAPQVQYRFDDQGRLVIVREGQ